MARSRRCDVFEEDQVGVYHCINRCVQRAYLCGNDPVSGKNFDYRKQWVRDGLELLAAEFAIEVTGFAVLDNHLHVTLRNRPDVVAQWPKEEVARRWWNLFPGRKNAEGRAEEPTEAELQALVAKPEDEAKLRRRLSNISWFMRCLCEPIARRANREMGTTGRFFEGRFKSIRLLDAMAVLVCMMYVDLNPIRAGIATTPEESRFTSAYERIHAHSQHALKQVAPDSQAVVARPSLCRQSKRHAGNDDWLSPIRGPAEPPLSVTGRRASNDPCLVMSLAEYLQLLDWTGRQVLADKKGSIPAHLAPILERVSLEASHWVDLVQNLGKYFRRAVGTPQHLAEEAVRQGRRWLQGISHARQVCC